MRNNSTVAGVSFVAISNSGVPDKPLGDDTEDCSADLVQGPAKTTTDQSCFWNRRWESISGLTIVAKAVQEREDGLRRPAAAFS
jgi:hypothetical protein